MKNTEYNIISSYFDRYINMKNVILGIGDDAAIVTVPKNCQLAITTDTIVCGIHFLDNIFPEDLAYKILAVNLSDLSAMGAEPRWLSLSLTIPTVNNSWLNKFSNSLFYELNYYKIQLIGGDITRGPLSITGTANGFIPNGKSIKRFGASDGDLIYVLGTLGNSAIGFEILKSKLFIDNKKDRDWLIKTHLRPKIWISHGIALRDIASSMIDISDGLISSINQILKINNCGAKIELDLLPLSDVVNRQIDKEQALIFALNGGEDYSLCFTVPRSKISILKTSFSSIDENCYCCIGYIDKTVKGIQYFYEGEKVTLNLIGFEHFV